jgi:tetratricopeptide (TPR) repeat protein
MKTTKQEESAVDVMSEFLDSVIEEATNGVVWKEEDAKEEFKKKLHNPLDTKKIEERCDKGLAYILQHLGAYPNDRLCLKELEKAAMIAATAPEQTKVTQKKHAHNIANVDPRLAREAMIKHSAQSDESDLPPSLADQWHISHETLATFYDIGTKAYNDKKIEDAICVFTYLSLLNGYSHEVWLSLGICHFQAEEWVAAIQAYTMANLINPHDPLPFFYSIDSYLKLNNKVNAETALHMAKYFITDENREQMAPLVEYYEKFVHHA